MSVRSLLGNAAPRARSLRGQAPVPYTSKWRTALADFHLGARGMDTAQELQQYGDTGTLFGIVSKLASTTSLVRWRLYKSAASGLDEDRVEISNASGRQNPALTVQQRPNNFMPWQEFCETFQQHIDLTGLAYWIVVRMGTVPVEMWPVRPDRMHVVPSVKDFIAGYVYVSPDGEEVPLRREDVICLRWPAPLDIYGGMSPLPALAGDISNEVSQREWSESFYRNSATPGGIIETGVRLGDTEFDELLDRWNRAHRGVNNAGRVAVLEQGKFTPLGFTQRDMQYVEGRNFTKQALLDAYGFPKFGLGDVQDVNRASADASKAYMAESLTVPRLERIKAALNLDFLPMFGMSGVEFDYDNPVPEDQETENATLTTRVTALVALAGAGFDTDESCDVVELPRIPFEKPEPAPVQVPSTTGGALPPGQEDTAMPEGGMMDDGEAA